MFLELQTLLMSIMHWDIFLFQPRAEYTKYWMSKDIHSK